MTRSFTLNYLLFYDVKKKKKRERVISLLGAGGVNIALTERHRVKENNSRHILHVHLCFKLSN